MLSLVLSLFFALTAGPVADPPAAATPSPTPVAPVGQPLVGAWTGSLTYADFGSGRTVVLPTTLTVTPDGPDLRFVYVYDDGPHKIVHDAETVAIDAAGQTYRVRGKYEDLYRSADLGPVLRRGRGTIVLAGSGIDNDARVEVRETMAIDTAAFVMRREVRRPGGTFFTRHIYRFTRTLPPEGFASDAAILRRAYQALHPGLERYTSPRQFDRHVADLANALRAGPTVPQAFLAFSRFTATVRCGHSYPNFFNQSGALAQAIFDGTNRVPFFFTWRGGRMIVTRNFSGNAALTAGSVVSAIDGRPTGTILAGLVNLARADGSNDAKRIDELGLRGNERYEAFDVYFPLLFPTPKASFDLRVTTLGSGTERSLQVDAQSADERLAQTTDAEAAPSTDPLWKLRLLDDRTALLSMPTWVTYRSTWDWRAFLATVFTRLSAAGTPNLVIDLRGNEGGTADVGSALAAHLIDTPVAPLAARSLVRYRAIPADLAPYLETWDPSFKDWGTAAQPFDGRFFALHRDVADGAPLAPQAPAYRGRVWVLVDAANSSATFDFDRFVHDRHLATLVGTPTGGNLRGSNGGAFFFVRLPNTGIEVDLPLIGMFPVAPAPDAGLPPDIALEATAADIAAGRDVALDAVRARIAAPSPSPSPR